MNRWGHAKRSIIPVSAVALWLSAPLVVWAGMRLLLRMLFMLKEHGQKKKQN